MPQTALDLYVAGFVARHEVRARPGSGGAGLYGSLGSVERPRTRLLITDDDAYEQLALVLPAQRSGQINVVAAATRCVQLVAARREWERSTAQGMICRDLGDVPEAALPRELTLRRVRRLPDDAPDGVPLHDALVVLASGSAADAAPSPTAVKTHLQSLSPVFRLFAAVDDDGVVRATSACGVFGAWAVVIFVNTDPGWRRRGLGLTMTAVALRDARRRGARQACLDSSDAGLSVYRRLGFESAGAVVRFSVPG